MIFNTIEKLNDKFEGNIIFVGGVSEMLLGLKETVNDIDIVFYDEKYICDIPSAIKKELPTMPFMGYKFYFDGFYIDGYLSKIEYPYIEISGIKCQSLEQLIKMKEMALNNNWLTNQVNIDKLKNSLSRLKKIGRMDIIAV